MRSIYNHFQEFVDFSDFEQNPYWALKKAGIDKIDLRLLEAGMPRNDPHRIREIAFHYARHSGLKDTAVLVSGLSHQYSWHNDEVCDALRDREFFKLLPGGHYYMAGRAYEYESELEQRLLSLTATAGRSVPTLEGVTAEQQNAAELVLSKRIGVLVGPPGVGKTYLVQKLYDVFPKAVLCATTGMAAKRLHPSARTVHSVLGGRPNNSGNYKFLLSPEMPFETDMIICDEASMLDSYLAYILIACTRAQILLVADYNQLPPVSAGAPLRDIVEFDGVPVARLTECHRHDGELLQFVNDVREAKPRIRVAGEAVKHIGTLRGNKSTYQSSIIKIVRDRGLDEDNSKIICATKTMRQILNEALQSHYNAANKDDAPFWRDSLIVADEPIPVDQFGCYCEEERMETDYSHTVPNGEEGRVLQCYGGDLVDTTFCKFVPWSKIKLGYVLTCHKAQGGQWENVVVLMENGGKKVIDRSWIYTAVSRAKDAVHIAYITQGGTFTVRNAIDKGFDLETRNTLFRRAKPVQPQALWLA